MIALDASVMIAYNYSLDPHHESALRIVESGQDEGLVAHPMSIAETLVGAARVGRENELLALLREIGVQATRPGVAEPLELAQLRARTGLRLPDCCVLSAARSANASLATFDDRLASVARELGIEVLAAL